MPLAFKLTKAELAERNRLAQAARAALFSTPITQDDQGAVSGPAYCAARGLRKHRTIMA
jgi:hypothetical protein